MATPGAASGHRRDHARAFGPAAGLYDASRPGYPDAVVDALLADVPTGTVVDVGAGTGKLTALLAARRPDVVAVEPSEGMRTQLAAVLPGVGVLDGAGERIPVPDGSVAAVLAAQAWHWVDPVAGSAEVVRALRPGGVLGLVWNTRDEQVDWVGELGRLLASADGPGRGRFLPDVRPPLQPLDSGRVDWLQPMTADRLVDLVATRSYVLLQSEADRADLLAAVRELTATHPDLAGRAEFDLPYVAEYWRFRI
ncbi:methyltransferase domain-containing protein [Nakamurella sp. YIM 132087]|uniref:Methyltransferase domain-containing protein n=1 Tax=Nakamurella alba TaxID=2665158 RepID=A0A7K1FQR1_9ACTN|nr:class I SAM-dependent methyltransferase [Nakamurella alba]MTD15583.1 methyltransferase domain-containing protein [Nakamurella alba]